MFSDRISAKAVVVSFVAYLVITIVCTTIVVMAWMPPGVPPGQVAALAESDPTLLLWQNVCGAVFGILAGTMACWMSGSRGLRNSAALGVLFVLYGLLGIYLHPSHPGWMQAGKLLSPVPLTLLGGWLCLRVGAKRAT